MKKTLRDFRKEYNSFIDNIDTYLCHAKDFLNQDELTLSIDEISQFVKNFHQTYFELNKEPLNKEIENIFIAYMGEAFIKHKGGKWSLETYKRDKAYGDAVIIDWEKDAIRVSTKSWLKRIQKWGYKEFTIETVFS